MKDLIKNKLNEHIDKILAKEELTNEDAACLLSVLHKIEDEEQRLRFEAESKERTKKMFEQMQELM